ncbi:MAG: hypothetical protein AVDCRST_MAG50-2287 [uncultured Acidimicrobiales bacterium]|uniref:Uncharacterized protein n=1 Tax=uncultured Acidimicrobiales bacterium TaxID=310071 RepID=A0A6J4IKW3_9ACTN|nr:MAG: hypothetical protein AVDCRST_MAG50-2287 [uncultured Acidimicrobiales bacterium]
MTGHAGPLDDLGALRSHLGHVPCSSTCYRCLGASLVDLFSAERRTGAFRRAVAGVAVLAFGLAAAGAGTTPLPGLVESALAASAPGVALPGAPHARSDLSPATDRSAVALRPTRAVDRQEPAREPGYRLVAADGGVFNHGGYGDHGSATGLAGAPVVGIAQTADGAGYWLAGADGGVFAFGSASFLGSMPETGVRLRAPIVGISASPDGRGYWLTASDGGVFTFGTAAYHGSGVEVGARSIAGMAVAPGGQGYWLVGTDGGVFSFGSAGFHGSAVGMGAKAPMLELVPTASGLGYWLVGTDGGVFAFGDAPFHGSISGQRINGQIAGMAVSPGSNGYWLVATDGGVFSFGDAPYLGSPSGTRLNAPVTAIVAGTARRPAVAQVDQPAPRRTVLTPGRSMPATTRPVVPTTTPPTSTSTTSSTTSSTTTTTTTTTVPVAVPVAAAPVAEPDIGGRFGWDISYPQCGGPFPTGKFEYGIVGVNGGRPYRHNPCLAEQWRWATRSGAAGVYVNVSFPRSPAELSAGSTSERQPRCNGELACIAYNWGYNGVVDAMTYARSQGVDPPFVWLDVEVLNYWTADTTINAVVIRGAIDGVRAHGKEPGLYSTPLQWGRIAGSEAPGLPVWSAGADGLGNVGRYCLQRGFGGGPVAFVQLLPGQFDPNVACHGAGPSSRYFSTK